MILSQVPGNDEGVVYVGVQNNPEIGDTLKPVDIVVDEDSSATTSTATGDATFWVVRRSWPAVTADKHLFVE